MGRFIDTEMVANYLEYMVKGSLFALAFIPTALFLLCLLAKTPIISYAAKNCGFSEWYENFEQETLQPKLNGLASEAGTKVGESIKDVLQPKNLTSLVTKPLEGVTESTQSFFTTLWEMGPIGKLAAVAGGIMLLGMLIALCNCIVCKRSLVMRCRKKIREVTGEENELEVKEDSIDLEAQ